MPAGIVLGRTIRYREPDPVPSTAWVRCGFAGFTAKSILLSVVPPVSDVTNERGGVLSKPLQGEAQTSLRIEPAALVAVEVFDDDNQSSGHRSTSNWESRSNCSRGSVTPKEQVREVANPVAPAENRLFDTTPGPVDRRDLVASHQTPDGESRLAHGGCVIQTYLRPYDASRPVVCFDEASRQLFGEGPRNGQPAVPRATAKVDYEYERRKGVDVQPVHDVRAVAWVAECAGDGPALPARTTWSASNSWWTSITRTPSRWYWSTGQPEHPQRRELV